MTATALAPFGVRGEDDGPGSLAARLLTPPPADRLAGWVVTLLVTAFAGVLRFYHLGRLLYLPGQKTGTYIDKSSGCVKYAQDIFDETYYHHDALSLLQHGVEDDCKNLGPGFVVHPPLGKWMIGAGIKAFGNNPFGWRFSAALCGTLAVLIFIRIARRMFGSTLLGAVAGLLMTLDGLEFVQSRTGILDIFILFFVVAATATLLLDREDGRRRLYDRMADGAARARPGPFLGMRWWRLATGVLLGCAIAVKWNGLYIVPGFAALAFAWDVGARRTAGIPAPVRSTLRRDWFFWVPGFILLPIITYTASWAGWFLNSGNWAYDRHLDGRSGIVGSTQNWLQYQCDAYNFAKNLTDNAHYGGGTAVPFVPFCQDAHTLHLPGQLNPSLSKPFGWFFLSRPAFFYYESPTRGVAGCHASTCSAEVLDIGTPAIWWVGLPALVAVFLFWTATRDWRAAMIFVAFASSFAPWLAYESRQMFIFYALPIEPFIFLAIVFVLAKILGPPGAGENRRLAGALGVGGYVTLVAVNFFYFYPIFVGDVIPYTSWHARMWFPGWI